MQLFLLCGVVREKGGKKVREGHFPALTCSDNTPEFSYFEKATTLFWSPGKKENYMDHPFGSCKNIQQDGHYQGNSASLGL